LLANQLFTHCGCGFVSNYNLRVASLGVFTVPLLQLNIDVSHPNSPNDKSFFGPGTNKETAQ
jgi:hypothetical protein